MQGRHKAHSRNFEPPFSFERSGAVSQVEASQHSGKDMTGDPPTLLIALLIEDGIRTCFFHCRCGGYGLVSHRTLLCNCPQSALLVSELVRCKQQCVGRMKGAGLGAVKKQTFFSCFMFHSHGFSNCTECNLCW